MRFDSSEIRSINQRKNQLIIGVYIVLVSETYTKFVAVLLCATLATFRNDRFNRLNIFEIGSILITFPCLGFFFNLMILGVSCRIFCCQV